jgi:hypothetical protein
MNQDLDHQMRRIKGHLDSAADYARRAKNDANSNDPESASSNIRRAADEIESAITLVNRVRRELP